MSFGNGAKFVVALAKLESPVFLLASTIEAAHSNCARSVMFLESILSIFAFPKFLDFEKARCAAKCTSVMSGLSSSMQCLAILVCPKRLSHTF